MLVYLAIRVKVVLCYPVIVYIKHRWSNMWLYKNKSLTICSYHPSVSQYPSMKGTDQTNFYEYFAFLKQAFVKVLRLMPRFIKRTLLCNLKISTLVFPEDWESIKPRGETMTSTSTYVKIFKEQWVYFMGLLGFHLHRIYFRHIFISNINWSTSGFIELNRFSKRCYC